MSDFGGSERQKKGHVLEEAVYWTLVRLLQQQMNTNGKEAHTDYGMVWVGHETLFLFWNSQVPKRGSYTDDYTGEKILNWRQPDLVLCHRIWSKSEFSDSYDWSLLPIVVIELKNYNMAFRWNKAWLFDRDVTRRFLTVGPAYITKLLNQQDWRKNPRNLFPNALKILIQPVFDFTAKAERIPRSRKSLTKGERISLYKRQQAGIIPASNSEKDKIIWRINRLGLIVYQLGYQLPIGEKLPQGTEDKLSLALGDWLKESLRQNLGRAELPQSPPLPAYCSQKETIDLQRARHNRWDYLIQTCPELPQLRRQSVYRTRTHHPPPVDQRIQD